MEVKDVISRVLREACLMSLATYDSNGPWSSILAFNSDTDFNLYWMSEPTARHSSAVLESKVAAASLTLTTKPEDDNIGLQIFGKVEQIENSNGDLLKNFVHKDNNLIYAPRHEVQGFLEKWYKLTPEYIDVTYEPEWSFIKRRYEISKS